MGLKKLIEGIPFKNWVLGLFLANILTIVCVVLMRRNLPPTVPLFYGRPYGAEQLSDQAGLVLPPLIALSICILNTAINLKVKDDFARKVLVGGMAISTILAIVTVFKISFLVGNL